MVDRRLMTTRDGRPSLSRRVLLARSAAATGLTIVTPLGRMTPAQARIARAPTTTLSPTEATALAAFGDVLLPGAVAAGLVEYVDSQLTAEQPLLMYRYLDAPTPADEFYRESLSALDAYALARFGSSFVDCAADRQTEIATALAAGAAENWPGPPASLVYFVIRSDTLDVVYGTVDGFQTLGVPYMAHIEPTARW